MEIQEILKNRNFKKWFGQIIVIFFSLFFIYEFIEIFLFHEISDQVLSQIEEQKKWSKSLNNKSNADIQKIENVMNEQMIEMNKSVLKMQADMISFQNDMSNGIDRFNKEWNEMSKQRKEFHKVSDKLMSENKRRINADMAEIQNKYFVKPKN